MPTSRRPISNDGEDGPGTICCSATTPCILGVTTDGKRRRRLQSRETGPTAEEWIACRGHGGWFGNIEDGFPLPTPRPCQVVVEVAGPAKRGSEQKRSPAPSSASDQAEGRKQREEGQNGLMAGTRVGAAARLRFIPRHKMLDRPRDGRCDWSEGRRTGEGMDFWDRSRITVDAAGARPAPPQPRRSTQRRLCPSKSCWESVGESMDAI
ncbi:hypothetical protein QBC39DRAFT_432675 [Podospora conica]|nr:hypothetical protein QBC39DRAFT_432675 [Schizothecium conicum]